MESSEEEAMVAVSQGIDRAFEMVKNGVILLMENTAGQGTEIGYQFDQIKKLSKEFMTLREWVSASTQPIRMKQAMISPIKMNEKTLEAFDKAIDLKRLHLLHLNDSKTPLGSRKDRHWHIGEGYIGLEGFRYLINHPLIRHLPGIMETPRKDTVEDLKNMEVIRSLVEPSPQWGEGH